MGKCAVWVNGRKVAEHFGGYLPFAADITAALRPGGKDNVIAVRADNSDDPTYPPGKPQNDLDFTYLGGIYRDAYLISTPAVHVTLPELSKTIAGGGVFVGVKDVNGNDASARSPHRDRQRFRRAAATSRCAPCWKRPMAAKLLAQRTVAGTRPRREPPGRRNRSKRKNVRLWHPDDPYLALHPHRSRRRRRRFPTACARGSASGFLRCGSGTACS